MYLPLSLIDLLLPRANKGLRRKGRSTETMTAYLSNEEFLQLARQGYFDTHGVATEHPKKLIQGSMDHDHGVVLTVDHTESLTDQVRSK